MNDADISEFNQEYLRILSELSNIKQSNAQRQNLVNTILLLLSNQHNLIGIYGEISQGSKPTTQNQSFIYGIEHELMSSIFKNAEMYRSNIIEDNFQVKWYHINSDEISPIYTSKDFNNSEILETVFQGDLVIKFYLIKANNKDISESLVHFVQVMSKILSNTYSALDNLEQLKASTLLEREIFNQNYYPLLVLHRDYSINRVNNVARSLFPGSDTDHSQNFIEMILSQEMYQRVHNDIVGLPTGLEYELLNQKVLLEDGREANQRYNIKIKKLSVEHSFQILIMMEQVSKSGTEAIKSELENPTNSLLNELQSYAKLYFSSQQDALDYGRSNFFPAAFFFTINEHIGPIILASSPEIDHDDTYEEAIKLTAGLNTGQIVSQGYVTGSTPWTHPTGEMRWIAFAINNPKARGDVEIHVIGLVAKENLLMIRTDLSNTLFGLLLGSMNQFMELIANDRADFVTEDFNFDRYFSTISVAQNILKELRTGSAEVLAALSSQS